IKKGEEGIVQSSLKPRCIACSNCVLACPFGIPKIVPEYEQMMKCDMCYDRTSVGKRPMCATVCPSQALAYLGPEEIARRREKPVNTVRVGNEIVRTKVFLMAPAGHDEIAIDITAYMLEGGPSCNQNDRANHVGERNSQSSRPTRATSAVGSSPNYLLSRAWTFSPA